MFGRPPPATIAFPQGSQFAASAPALRRIGRAKLEWAWQLMEEGHLEVCYLLELSWFYLRARNGLDPSTSGLPLTAASLLTPRRGDRVASLLQLAAPKSRKAWDPRSRCLPTSCLPTCSTSGRSHWRACGRRCSRSTSKR